MKISLKLLTFLTVVFAGIMFLYTPIPWFLGSILEMLCPINFLFWTVFSDIAISFGFAFCMCIAVAKKPQLVPVK